MHEGRLLERGRELEQLDAALTGARAGRGRLVLVEARAGLGKTSLLQAASELATSGGFTCLRARASELERDFAYGCVRQLLEPAVAKLSGPEPDGLFAGAAALSRPLFASSAAPPAAAAADSAFSMLHGLYWLLNNLAAETPLTLLVDDLHWSDLESLRFLAYLAPRLDGLALIVIASTRPAEGATPDVARLAAAPETTLIRLAPLSLDATTTLCRRRLGANVAEELAGACREVTGGNPFFLEALLRELDEKGLAASAAADRVRRIGPAAVAETVLLRLSGAPAAATALVRAVAILGDGVRLADAAQLAEVDPDEAGRATDLLVALAILTGEDGLSFAHPIVREAVYADIGPHQRQEAHARAARILAANGAPEERIAAQIAAAEPAGDQERVELLRRVAAQALVRGAPSAAAAWLARALAEPPAPASMGETLLELGWAELRLARPEAVDHLTGAVELIREPEPLTTAVRLLANALTMFGDADRAVEAVEAKIPVVEAADGELALLLEAELAAHAQEASREARAPAARRLQRHRDLRGDTPGERLVLACLEFERARSSETASEAAAHLERALADGRLLGEQELDAVGAVFDALVVGLLSTDALDLVDACLAQALSDARSQASIPAVSFVLAYRGRVALRRGAVSQAQVDALAALELLTTHAIPLGVPLALGVLVEALVEAGELDAADRAIEEGAGETIPPSLVSNHLLEARGALRLAQGRTDEGRDDLIAFGRRDELWGGANPLASRWRSRAALALATLGDTTAAQRMALEDLERARRWGAASGIGVALRTAALVEGGPGSVARLREAAATLERSPARLEEARVLVDLGAALRRGNRRAEARGLLAGGLDLAERCGAHALARQARIELRAAGGRTGDPYGRGVEQLTASERRIAELAASGHSNPEIAQILFVTRKTVETHLGHVYRKLGIAGRRQLEPVLTGEGRRPLGSPARAPGRSQQYCAQYCEHDRSRLR